MLAAQAQLIISAPNKRARQFYSAALFFTRARERASAAESAEFNLSLLQVELTGACQKSDFCIWAASELILRACGDSDRHATPLRIINQTTRLCGRTRSRLISLSLQVRLLFRTSSILRAKKCASDARCVLLDAWLVHVTLAFKDNSFIPWNLFLPNIAHHFIYTVFFYFKPYNNFQFTA